MYVDYYKKWKNHGDVIYYKIKSKYVKTSMNVCFILVDHYHILCAVEPRFLVFFTRNDRSSHIFALI